MSKGFNTFRKDFALTLIVGFAILGAFGVFGLVNFLIILVIFNFLFVRIYKPEENIGIPVAA